MAWYIENWVQRYPKTMDFLINDFVGLTIDNAKVMDAFIETAALTASDARRIVSFTTASDSPPLIWFKDLGALAGLFEKDHPPRILINSDIASRFEDASGDDRARSYLQAKVLHEMVHWSLFRQGDIEPGSVEMGVEFENRAFGAPLAPFWIRPTAAPSSTTASEPLDHGAISIEQGVAELDNSHLAAGLPRGIRNNNPGNIKRGPIAWEGLAQQDEMTDYQRYETVFCVFRAPIFGLRAMARLLYVYQQRYKLVTIEAMINRWAPPGDDNKTDAYIDFVCARAHLHRLQVFDFAAATYAVPVIAAMVKMENGIQPYALTQIQRAHEIAIA